MLRGMAENAPSALTPPSSLSGGRAESVGTVASVNRPPTRCTGAGYLPDVSQRHDDGAESVIDNKVIQKLLTDVFAQPAARRSRLQTASVSTTLTPTAAHPKEKVRALIPSTVRPIVHCLSLAENVSSWKREQ
jgi:hypothetical protein